MLAEISFERACVYPAVTLLLRLTVDKLIVRHSFLQFKCATYLLLGRIDLLHRAHAIFVVPDSSDKPKTKKLHRPFQTAELLDFLSHMHCKAFYGSCSRP